MCPIKQYWPILVLLMVGLLAWLGHGHTRSTRHVEVPAKIQTAQTDDVFAEMAPETERATLNACTGVSVPPALWRAVRFVVLTGSFEEGRFAPQHRPPLLSWEVHPAQHCPIQDWLVWTGQLGLAPPMIA